MRIIHKYQLELGDQTIELPKDSKIVYVGQQYGSLKMWVDHDIDMPKERRVFTIFGTGHPIPDGVTYIGTVPCDPFVWHVYELTT